MNVRKYQKKDREQVRKICLANADVDYDDKALCDFILYMFCDYYIDCEPDNCFVAVDDNDIPFGYVYGALDYDKYDTVFRDDYLPRIEKISKGRYEEALVEMNDHAIYKKKYPSHLHIDILSGNQGAGTGSKLIQSYIENVRNNGSCGVMLIVGTDNTRAQSFYMKNGLDTLHIKDSGVAMGKQFIDN